MEKRTEKNHVFEIGPIRPPSEAGSLLLRVTRGCTWNKCKFCDIYRGSAFQVLPEEEVFHAIDEIAYFRDRINGFKEQDGWDTRGLDRDLSRFSTQEQECYYMVLNWLANGGQNVFLQDGNSVALAPDKLIRILRYLKSKLPEVRRITTYGRAESLSRITEEQYVKLREAGLNRIHSGFESGSDAVLTMINKGVTAEQEIQAGRRIKAAAIELSVYFMPGVGGKNLSKDNAYGTAQVISAINPDFVRLRTSVIKPGTDLWKEQEQGVFEPCSDLDKLTEIRLLISEIKGCNGYLYSDHIINLLQNISGRLDRDREKMLAAIDSFLKRPEEWKRQFQLARRAGMVVSEDDFESLDTGRKQWLRKNCEQTTGSEDWEALMNQYLRRYI